MPTLASLSFLRSAIIVFQGISVTGRKIRSMVMIASTMVSVWISLKEFTARSVKLRMLFFPR